VADTIREKVVQALVARLGNITLANGYNYALGAAVKRCRQSYSEAEMPALTVWDRTETATMHYQVMRIAMETDIDAVVGTTADGASTAAGKVIADIVKAVTGGDSTLGGVADGILYNSAEPQYHEDGSEYVTVRVSLTLLFRHKAGDPYTQP
jgi:hypothetical protein